MTERRTAYAFVLPALVLFGVFILTPTLATFVLSLFDWSGGGEIRFVGLRNYRIAFTGDEIFLRSLRNNAVYMVATLVLEVGTGLILAVLLDLKRRGYGLFRVLLFTPMTLSLTVIGLMWYFIFHPYIGALRVTERGLLGDERTALLAVCLVSGWTYCGFYMVLFYAALQGIPRELYEAALIDGAGEIRRILHISLPLLRETTLVSVLLCMTGAFKAYDLFFVMTRGGPHHATENVSTWLVRSAFSAESARMGYAAALAAITTVLVFLITVLYVFVSRRTRPEETA